MKFYSEKQDFKFENNWGLQTISDIQNYNLRVKFLRFLTKRVIGLITISIMDRYAV